MERYRIFLSEIGGKKRVLGEIGGKNKVQRTIGEADSLIVNLPSPAEEGTLTLSSQATSRLS